MDKRVISFLLASSACFAAGSREINKTFIKPSEPMAIMLGDRLISCRSRDDDFDRGAVSIDVTTFYRSSIEPNKLGKALGYNGHSEIGVFDQPDEAINPGEFFYTYRPADVGTKPEVSGTIRLRPTERVWGAVVQLYRQLKSDWYIGAQIPFVRVSRDLGRKIINGTHDSELDATLERYLDGKYEQRSGVTVQEKLKFAKMSGKSQSTYGLSDCTIYAGKMLLDGYDSKITAWADLLISSKDRVAGEHLFEPVLGNGGFNALGAGLAGQMTIHETINHTSGMRFYIKGRVFEKDAQFRTFGLRLNGRELADEVVNEDSAASIPEFDPYYARPWGHLILGGQTGQAGFFPLANRLTREIDVRPGAQLDVGTSFFMQSRNVDVQFGYGMIVQQSEDISCKTPLFDNEQIGYNSGKMQYYPANVAIASEAGWDISSSNSHPREVVPELTSCQVTHTISHQLFVKTNFHLWDETMAFYCSGAYQWAENRIMVSAWEFSLGLKMELF